MASQSFNVKIEADGSGFGVVTVNGQHAGWARAVGTGADKTMRISMDVALGDMASLLAYFDGRSRLWTLPSGVTFATEYQRGDSHMPRILEETRSTPVVTRKVDTPSGHRFTQGERRGQCATCGQGTRAMVHRVANDAAPAPAAPDASLDVDALAAALKRALGL